MAKAKVSSCGTKSKQQNRQLEHGLTGIYILFESIKKTSCDLVDKLDDETEHQCVALRAMAEKGEREAERLLDIVSNGAPTVAS